MHENTPLDTLRHELNLAVKNVQQVMSILYVTMVLALRAIKPNVYLNPFNGYILQRSSPAPELGWPRYSASSRDMAVTFGLRLK